MWQITVLFAVFLWLAHLAIGMPEALRLHISEMRPLTLLAHVLFLLLMGSGLCFARRARSERHDLSAGLGNVIALSVAAAWVTPTHSNAHNYFAGAPFLLLFLYVPLMLFHGGYFAAAILAFIVPWLCDMLMWFAAGGSSGELQKLNALLFLGLLNFVYYRILPATHPLLHPPYLEAPRPRLTDAARLKN
jgi:hypothetical protein